MHVLLYIWRNLKRNKLRSTLTILSVGFSLALLTVLHGYMAMQGEWGKEAEKHARIVIMNSQGFSGPVPIAYLDKIRSVPGIAAATPYAWYGGNYKEEKVPFAQFGTDADNVFNVWDEFRIDPEQLSAWRKTRSGCVVDRRLAEKRKWKIGERIPLQGTFYPFNLDLVLCGMFDSPKNTDSLWFHWQYLDEGLKQFAHPTGIIVLTPDGRIARYLFGIDYGVPLSPSNEFIHSGHPNPSSEVALFWNTQVLERPACPLRKLWRSE
jgi:putative ABC transport system permease protein